jgi:hypothetical protein
MGAKMKRKSKCRQDALTRALYDNVVAFWTAGLEVSLDHPYYQAFRAYIAEYPSDAVDPLYTASAVIHRAWEAIHGKAQ